MTAAVLEAYGVAGTLWDEAKHPRNHGKFAPKAGADALDVVYRLDVAKLPDKPMAVAKTWQAGGSMIAGQMREKGGLKKGGFLRGTAMILDKWMDAAPKTTHPVLVHRGVADPRAMFGKAWREGRSNEGLEWRDPAFVSTTVDHDVAQHFATEQYKGAGKPVVMHITVPAGSQALHLDDPSYDQQELLLDRGYRYRVTHDHGVGPDGIHHLDVEATPGKKEPL